jgi:putative transposase
VVTPAARREAVAHLEEHYEMSERRAWAVIGADRSSVRYPHRRPDDAELCEELHKAPEKHRRFGYRRLPVILRRDGHVLTASVPGGSIARRVWRCAAAGAASAPWAREPRW